MRWGVWPKNRLANKRTLQSSDLCLQITMDCLRHGDKLQTVTLNSNSVNTSVWLTLFCLSSFCCSIMQLLIWRKYRVEWKMGMGGWMMPDGSVSDRIGIGLTGRIKRVVRHSAGHAFDWPEPRIHMRASRFIFSSIGQRPSLFVWYKNTLWREEGYCFTYICVVRSLCGCYSVGGDLVQIIISFSCPFIDY